MNASTFRVKVLEEIQRIPAGKLMELYDLIHYFRVGLEASKGQPLQIMKFAGCWNGMPEKTFLEFSREIVSRRHHAFSTRRIYETGAN